MKKRFSNKVVVCILVLALALLTFSACSKNAGQSNTDNKTSAQPKTKTIVDQSGRSVVIPDKIDRVVSTSMVPLPAVYYLVMGSMDKMVAIHPGSLSAAKSSMLARLAPDVLNMKTEFISNDIVNMEELLALKPDIVFYRSLNDDETKQLEGAGLTAIGINPNYDPNGNVINALNSWLELVGKVMGQENRTEKIIQHSKSVEKEILAKTAAIAEKDKPRVLFLYKHAGGKIEVAGSNFFSQYWLETTGAINVAAELKGATSVNMEQIYSWNPDKIYITNFTEVQPADLYNNTIEGEDWSQLKAVQNKEVYKNPLGIYRWFPPSGDAPLMLKWLAQHNHPSLFTYDMNKEIKTYYSEFYGYNLTDDEVRLILNPVYGAAAGAYVKR